MNYHNITTDDMLNGDGLRVVLWTAGCTHKCKNCQNPITWDLQGGIPFDDTAKSEIFHELEKDYISGITFSGGDPLHPENRQTITDLAIEISKKYPEKTLWLYTGFQWEEICSLDIINYIDILVDGRYIDEQCDTKLYWRGSKNQRVIDVQKTLATGLLTLYCD